MEHEFFPSANADQLVSPSISPLLFRASDHRIPSPPCHTTGCNNPGISHYLPSPKVIQYASSPPIPGTPVSVTSSPPCSLEDEDPSAIKNRLYLARLALQYQKIFDRYELCLTQLQDAEREAEAISLQNNTLRIANDQLYRRLNIDPADIKFRNSLNIEYPPISLLDEHFRRLSLAEPPDEESPTSVFGFHENPPPLGKKSIAVGDKRLTLPKSISVRSTGYLKIHQAGASGPEPNRLIRNRPPTPVMQEKVYLSGPGKKNAGETEDSVDLDLYNQGMLKTELCNKWQESGECPYGQHCQFAHGFDELRPIIRHPRYKTELCRMVVSGDTCPYGHRCHFRHVISPHDRLRRST
ncbi:Zinc finger CCCH domain-containing protein 9 [Platanthera zijinensis]|uniref:Zinc finger CCCH domain-containing protein 9 n=1 Tax=Platanthera zijinensis TaxID=2320716 RepID=A0AAP0FZQ7_9ASPA